MTTYTCPAGHQSADGDYCDTCGAPIAGDAGAAGGAPAGGAASPAAGSSLDLDAGSGPPAPAAPAGRVCPNCSTENVASALFCEDCGYDFTTGAMPPELAPLTPPDGPASGPVPLPVEAGTPAIGLPTAGAVSTGTPSAPSAPAGTPAPGIPAPAAAGSTGADPGAGTAEWVAELWVDPEWYQSQGADEPCPSPGPPIVVPLADRSLLVGRHSSSRNIHPQIDCGADSGVSRRHAQLTTDGQRWWVEDLQSANGTFVGTAGGSLPTSSIAPGLRREVAEDERLYVGAWTKIVIRRALPGE